MSNIDRHPECHMRTAIGNCDPLGGFCTSVNEPICEALHKASRPQGEWEIVGKNHPYKRCPFCKRVRAFTDTRFCDWCGARMKGAEDETRY